MKFKTMSEKEKVTLQLYREQEKLYHDKWVKPSIKLDKPYQKGWKRYFKVREDVARGPLGKIAEKILSVINRIDYSSREDFMKKGRKSKKYEPIKLGVGVIDAREWEKKKYPASWKKYFRLYESKWGQLYYQFQFSWWFTEIIEKHMITHYYEADAEIDSRIAEINKVIEHNKLDAVYMGMKKGRNLDEWDLSLERKKERNKLAKKEMKKVLNGEDL
jgi:hypothetical protein